MTKEKIVRAGIKWKDVVFMGYDHDTCRDMAYNEGIVLNCDSAVEGFVTSEGRFLSRAEAFSIAKMSGQLMADEERGSLESWMLPEMVLETFN